MTHPQQSHEERGSSFTITQFALGSPLQFEPALGSQELDNLISNYVPGSAMPQQKRAQVVLEFLNSIDALSYSHPVSIRYHVPQILTPQTMPRHSSMPSLNAPSPKKSTPREETLNTSQSTPSLKRSRDEVTPPNAASAKRLPGFSIMTRDGVDITDLASRGPKTKEQRDHAALMRRLKACAACKKSKQRCDPSHHRPAQTALSTPTPSSATPSNRSTRFSSLSSAGGSRGSISPQSSLGESFSHSPSQSFSDRAFGQTGQSFPPFSNAKPCLSQSDFTLPDNLLNSSDMSAMPMQGFDPELFQLADMELGSWNAGFTAFPPANNHNAWNSHEDIFAPTHVFGLSPETQGGIPSEQVRSGSLLHIPTFEEQVLSRQDHQERLARRPGQLSEDAYPESHVVEFDINQWLHSTTTQGDFKESKTPLAASAATGRTLKHFTLQQDDQNPVLSRDQDYILYPDSPQIEWGLEPHLVSRDIGNREYLPRRYRHIDKSSDEQDSQGPASVGARISGSDYHVPVVQSSHPLAVEAPYQYLPSPSPSSSSKDAKDTKMSDCNLSEAEDTAYDTQDSLSQCSTKSNYVQRHHRHSDCAQLDLIARRSDASASGNDEMDGYHGVHRTIMSPGQPQYLRSVITADVNVRSQPQNDQCNNTQFVRPQRSPSEVPIPDIQNHTMNFLDDQQAQQTFIIPDPRPSPADVSNWEQIWRQRDLRQAGLLGLPVESNNASQLHVSSQELNQVQVTADNTCDAFLTEDRQQSWCTTISSDLPGEDEGKKLSSAETLTRQCLALDRRNLYGEETSLSERSKSSPAQLEYSLTRSRSILSLNKKMTTIITLCMLMTISLLWTISLLTTNNDTPEAPFAKQADGSIYASEAQITHRNYQNDVRTISFGHDFGSPCQIDSGPGLDHTVSKLDFLCHTSDHVFDIESNPVLESRPVAETYLADDSFISEDYSGRCTRQPTPSSTFSILYGTPAFTLAPSTTKYATSWTTHLPARPTPQPKKASAPAMSQNRHEASVRSPSSSTISDLKRSWSRRFNIGHLAMGITSLTICDMYH